MKKLMKHAKTIATRGAVATAGLLGSSAVMAADYSTQITAAQTEGETNVGAATGAVIALAIVGFGVAAIVSWMRR